MITIGLVFRLRSFFCSCICPRICMGFDQFQDGSDSRRNRRMRFSDKLAYSDKAYRFRVSFRRASEIGSLNSTRCLVMPHSFMREYCYRSRSLLRAAGLTRQPRCCGRMAAVKAMLRAGMDVAATTSMYHATALDRAALGRAHGNCQVPGRSGSSAWDHASMGWHATGVGLPRAAPLFK